MWVTHRNKGIQNMQNMLTDKTIRSIKGSGKQQKHADGNGLTLVIQPNGNKLWWFRYRFGGKEKTLSIGQYPVVTLAEARDAAADARKLLKNGIDPMEYKKTPNKAEHGRTFEEVAREWIVTVSAQWSPGHKSKVWRRIDKDFLPHARQLYIKTATAPQILGIVRKVQDRGTIDTAHRLLQNVGQVFRFAIATGETSTDPTAHMVNALKPLKHEKYSSITEPEEIGRLMANIRAWRGETVKRALLIMAHTFVRHSELCRMSWDELDIGKRLWLIPSERMKTGIPHVVPLSNQSLGILDELRTINRDSGFVFPSPRGRTRPMSNAAMLSAVRDMGYNTDEMTIHGFRAMASTNLENMGYDSRLIELQLAHKDQNKIREAYKRNTHLIMLDERAKMMQAWSDWLDRLDGQ